MMELAAEGEDVSGFLERMPELSPEELEAWEAFRVLSKSRNASLTSIGAIPQTEIVAYFQRIELNDVDDADDMAYLIDALDEEFRDAVSENNEKDGDADG